MSTQRYERLAAALRRPLESANSPLPQLREWVRMGVLAASSHNTQPWRFTLGECALAIRPDFSRRCPVVDPDDAHLYKSLGCAAENVVQAAAAHGFASDVRYDADEDRITIGFAPGLASSPSELADAITRRQCTKLPFDGRPLANGVLQKLQSAGSGRGVQTLLITSRPRISDIVDLVAAGNRVQLGSEAFRSELKCWIRFNTTSAVVNGDGLAGRVSGQPGLPDYLAPWIIDFVLTAKAQTATDTRNILSSSGIAVTVAADNTRADWIETGRAWQRFALRATALGIRTAFINQPIEVPTLRPQLAQCLGLQREHPLLMVRFGYGPTAPFSLRRPLDDVIDAELLQLTAVAAGDFASGRGVNSSLAAAA